MTNASPQQKQEAKEQLSQAVGNSNQILTQATTVFPFTLFPDHITLDREQATIVHRSFIKLGEVVTIRIEDILNVETTAGPFFGSLRIYTRFFSPDTNAQRHYSINWLWREDALRIKRILHGYIIALKHKINCAALETTELARILDSMGQEMKQDET